VSQTSYISAQGNPDNSLSYFGQHIIVSIQTKSDNKVVDKYLDPSYGEEYDVDLEKMDKLIAAYWLELYDYTLPAFIFPAPSNGNNDLVLFRKNTTQEKLFILNEAQY